MNKENLVINQIQNQITTNRPSTNELKSSFGTCPQCNLIHPPLKQGEQCPNAPVQMGEQKVDFNDFLSTFRTILISQTEKKNITDYDKYFGYITIEITKAIEKYEE